MLAAVVFLASGLSGGAGGSAAITRRGIVGAIGGMGVTSAFAPAARAGLLGPFPGTPPDDLGIRTDGSLKGCGPSPNCWSTSGDPKHKVAPFEYTKSTSTAKADLLAVLKAYPQAGIKTKDGGIIDGGGNKLLIPPPNSDGNYYYAQFTSKKFGFVDDVEFNVGGGKVAIRSASRQGDSDLGVNAARLSYIAQQLAAKGGWKTELGI
ncbi:hypothetical protein KFE25_008627 [Diacronema lutheri]|uniref:Uncharacterized protein n=1 Tax=Diacronema lutheri TaxID=2081491 RepID=A0A8J5XWA6_DIALT|nr:hypothetical protein KFE25_008627 [Diacronema lutheri]|mmetsp:Transcript_5199/g.16300  ORF Transcript_5199/g.16300 Transcript_5199/m.16300 type:complete len:207 (-) Transcript_5199:713-1333(-)